MTIQAKIEIPKGSKYKYEEKNNQLILDRVLLHAYPQNYGYITNTIAEDGDALDVFVVGQDAIHPGTIVEVEILGIILMNDNGIPDHKLLTRIKGDNWGFNGTDIVSFLKNYKKGIEVIGLGTFAEAEEIIMSSIMNSYKNLPEYL